MYNFFVTVCGWNLRPPLTFKRPYLRTISGEVQRQWLHGQWSNPYSFIGHPVTEQWRQNDNNKRSNTYSTWTCHATPLLSLCPSSISPELTSNKLWPKKYQICFLPINNKASRCLLPIELLLFCLYHSLMPMNWNNWSQVDHRRGSCWKFEMNLF